MIDAIILGAGMGTRLRPLTDKLPKSLLKINTGTILEWQVKNLRELNFSDITIVVGYEAEKIKLLCKNYNWDINFIFNNIYSKTNNLYSLWLVIKEMHDNGFICINSDVVFDGKIIKRLLEDDSDTCLVVDKKICKPEDMKVKIKDSKIFKINKTMRNGVYGEFMGIAKFSIEGKKEILKVLNNMPVEVRKKANLGFGIQTLIDKGNFINKVDCGGFYCREIDFIEDLMDVRTAQYVQSRS